MMMCFSGKLVGGGRPEWVFVLVGSCPVRNRPGWEWS